MSDSFSFQILLVIGMLVTGSINTVSKKMGYATCGESILKDSDVTPCAAGYCGQGADGTCPTSECRSACKPGQHRFMKPWSQTLVMFAGEFMCIFVFFYKRRQYLLSQSQDGYVNEGTAMMSPADEIDSANKKGGIASMFSPSALFSPTHRKGRDVSANGKNSAYGTITCSSALVCILPAFCDVGGTTLSGIGLLFTSASVFQMLRGSIIVFTALLSVIFLKRKLWGYHYVGLILTIAGVTLVGLSSIMGAKADATSKSNKGTNMVFLGNVMVILSQLMSATQMVVEEKFLKGRKLPPEFVVGCEGMFGMLIMLIIILPTVSQLDGLDGGGVHEDPIDAVHLIGSNGKLLALVAAYWISIAFYNFCGLAVAKSLSSVHRCLIDACRTVLVWSVDLLLYHYTKQYGEPWDPQSSGMQLIGFGIMICGTFTYYKVVRLPFCNYEPEDEKKTQDDIQRLKENDELLLAEENRRKHQGSF